ncbi:MAG: tetratricopeptide repeat protein [Bacteroidales bacterium]|nr:tetratricopeptide repeat protein [Bacteroidales bacterium]
MIKGINFKGLIKKKIVIVSIITTIMISVIIFGDFYETLSKFWLKFFPVYIEDNVFFSSNESFNILILTFNDFQKNNDNNQKFETALIARYNKIINQDIFKYHTKPKLDMKFYPIEKAVIEKDSIRSIGKITNSDIVIYGDLFDNINTESYQANIKYQIIRDSKIPLQKEYETGISEYSSLYDVIEGSLTTDMDYMIYWLMVLEQMKKGRITIASKLLEHIDDKFKNENFFEYKNNFSSLLTKLAIAFRNPESNNISSIHFLNDAIKFNPNNLDALYNLGKSYAEISKYDSAFIYYSKSLKIDSTFAPTYYDLGVINTKLSKYDLAITNYNKAIRYKPDSIKPYNNLGVIYCHYLENPKLSEFYFLKAIDESPTHGPSHYGYGQLLHYKLKEYGLAKEHYKKAIEYDKHIYNAYTELSKIYLIYNDLSKAIKILNQLLEIKYDFADAHFSLALIYNLKQEYLLSESYCLEAINFEPKHALAHILLAKIMIVQYKDKSKAKDYYLKACSIDKKMRTKFNDIMFNVH